MSKPNDQNGQLHQDSSQKRDDRSLTWNEQLVIWAVFLWGGVMLIALIKVLGRLLNID